MNRSRVSVELPAGVHSWGALVDHATAVLQQSSSSIADREARWIVEHVAGFETAELFAESDAVAPARCVAQVLDALDRRMAGEPIQYVLGVWPFRHLELVVDRRVLIPRPETEWVAEVALREAQRQGARRELARGWATSGEPVLAVDLGTGSGALALALLSELPDAQVWASDSSEDALAVARQNLVAHGSISTRARLEQGSWFEALPDSLRGQLHLVVSNPPYISVDELMDLPPEVRDHEPHQALIAGASGFEAIEELVSNAPAWLRPHGALVVELAPHQAPTAVEMARSVGAYESVRVEDDLSHRARVLVAVSSAQATKGERDG